MNKLRTRLILTALIACTVTSATRTQHSQPIPQIVDLKSADGVVLKATYIPAGKPGPGILYKRNIGFSQRATVPKYNVPAALSSYSKALAMQRMAPVFQQTGEKLAIDRSYWVQVQIERDASGRPHTLVYDHIQGTAASPQQ
jgi:hypothetical protein